MADIPAYTEKLLAQLMADRRNLLVHSSDQLSSGFPSPDQLAGAIAFAPTQGNIWLFGRRYLLMQEAAFGELRRELIRGLGMEKARGIYTSTGWHAGARLARQVAQQWPAGDHGSLYSAGPRLHMLEGMVNVEPIHFAIDSGAGSFYSDMFWHNSLEAQEHLAHHGTAGDPDYATALTILRGLPEAGADVIEMGMPFTDPMADGPAIQLANQRALGNGMSLRKTLQMVSEFRQDNDYTPIVLMGYYNPIFHYGVDNFIRDAKQAGVDGLIVVDVPAEHNEELCEPAQAAGIDFIRLTTPTTDDVRLPTVLKDSSGFIYYVSVAGVTGGATASLDQVSEAVARLRRHSDLPVCIGFGIRTAEHAANVARLADGVVVGSALVDKINAAQTPEQAIIDVLAQCREISQGVHGARE